MQLSRRRTLQGLFGISLALPFLETYGAEELKNPARRFCAMYTANGMSLPAEKNHKTEWNWYPDKTGSDYSFSKSTEPYAPLRSKMTFVGGLHHSNGPLADPHVCSDMWLTGAPLHNPKPGTYNTVSIDQIIAQQTKKFCRLPSLVLSVDGGVGMLSRTGTISFNSEGRPIPAENNPRQIFNRLFVSSRDSLEAQRQLLKKRIKLVDAVLVNSKAFNKKLSLADREKMDQYLTSLAEVESRLEGSEKWIDIPLKKQDHSQLDLAATNEDPAKFYPVMFDLIALAFDADITRSVSFMLNREDGMGISETYPVKLGFGGGHHGLSHAEDEKGMINFAKYDQFLAQQISRFGQRLQSMNEGNGSVLDNSLVLFGTGASTTHKSLNLPHLLIGGSNMGLKHGSYIRHENGLLSDLFVSCAKAMDVQVDSFADSTGGLKESIFKA